MGFLKSIRKEVLINRLVRSYKLVYYCSDETAINNLRNNYSFEELKEIIEEIKIETKGMNESSLKSYFGLGCDLFKEELNEDGF